MQPLINEMIELLSKLIKELPKGDKMSVAKMIVGLLGLFGFFRFVLALPTNSDSDEKVSEKKTKAENRSETGNGNEKQAA